MAKTTVETLAADIRQILDDYGEDVTKMTKETVKKTGQKGVQALKSNSGIWGGSGKYASGWTQKVEETRFGATSTLHNAKVPGLPHLLEYDHAKRGGGRTNYAKSHIEPVEKELDRIFTSELEAGLR